MRTHARRVHTPVDAGRAQLARRLLGGLLLLATAALAQTPFTLDQVLSAPFPSSLTTTADGKVAWVSNARGVRNIMLAEPPEYRPRKLTSYTEDDGQEIADLRFTTDAIVYTRGGTANPESRTAGVSEDIWTVPLAGGAPRKLGEGDSPAVSASGRIAWVKNGAIWVTSSTGPAAQAFTARGTQSHPVWSPDGARLAFVTTRNDHALIAVWESTRDHLTYLDPATDLDAFPEWSPDSRSIAFVRIPSTGLRAIRKAQREGEPWSIRVADAATGIGHEIFRARPGRGSIFRVVTARNQLLWAANNRIVFPWEADGWTHLYAIPTGGGDPTLLTPGAFEVEDVDLSIGAAEITYSSNQNDIDRRHLWRVRVSGGPPTALTSGETIDVSPAGPAFLQSDARRPMHPVVRAANQLRDLDPLPAGFPTQQLVVPQQVLFPAADGLELHGQLFLPTRKPANGHSPALVFFHGGSRRQMLLGWHPMYYYANAYAMNQYLASLGYIVLSVNYRSGIGYGLDFREALDYGPSGASEYNDVQGAGVYLRSRSDVDPAHIGAWGGSYGGYLTAMALARASDLYKAGVDFHGVHDWAREIYIPVGEPDYKLAFESSPMNYLHTWHSPVLLIAGDDDPDVQFNQTVMLGDALRRRGIPMELLMFPDEVHDFLLYRTWRAAYEASAKFFLRRLPLQ